MLSQARPRTPLARPRARPPVERPSNPSSVAKAVAYVPVADPSASADGPMGRHFLQDLDSVSARVVAAGEPSQPSNYERDVLLAVAELARHYLFHGGLRVAQVLFEGLTAVAPDEPYFALGLALTCDRLNLPKEADAEYQRAEKLDPTDGRSDINRAEFALARGDRAQARALLARGAEKARRKNDGDLERKALTLLARLNRKDER